MRLTWRGCGLAILITLAAAALGALAGLAAVRLQAGADLPHWQNLGGPPGGAKQLLAVQKGLSAPGVELSVRGRDGEIYRSGADPSAWQLTSSPLGTSLYDCAAAFTQNRDPSFDQLPAEPVRCGSIIWSAEWKAESDLFVILADGSVRRWHILNSTGNAILWQLGLPVLAVLLAWIAGGLVLLLRARRS